MWYVIPHKWHVIPRNKTTAEHLAMNPTGFNNFDEAQDKAEYLREETGKHYYVVKIQTVWTTKTLAEAMGES